METWIWMQVLVVAEQSLEKVASNRPFQLDRKVQEEEERQDHREVEILEQLNIPSSVV